MSSKNVVMSNKIARGRYSFTKEEQNFIYSVISQISTEDEDFKVYKIDFKKQSELFETTKNYKRFMDFASNLITKPIKISDGDKKIVCSWFSYISHTNNNSYIECSFDPHLKPYLLQLKNQFVQAKLPVLLSFKSKYSSRLYLYLKSIYDCATSEIPLKKVTYEVGVAQLISEFEMPKSYSQRYSLFKNDFLVKSIEEIENLTDFKIYYLEHKTGRKITSIEFCITKKEKTQSQLIKEIEQHRGPGDYIPGEVSDLVIKILLADELDLKKHDIKNIFDHYTISDIEDVCLELYNSWDSLKLISRVGFFRGSLSKLNKKKTENFSFFNEIK